MIRRFSFAFIIMSVLFCASSAFAFTLNDSESLKFDFGAEVSPEWIHVDSLTKYDPIIGYGFSDTAYIEDSYASGTDVMHDEVLFKSTNTFNVDLSNGIYKIKPIAGDIDTINITAEGKLVIVNMTFNGCVSEAEIPVTDGQLNISVSSWKEDVPVSLSALEISRVSSLDRRRTHVFIGGDSIASTYYPLYMSAPLEQGYQGGWGQMLPLCIPSDLYVMNLASGGQTADGFLMSGQFDTVESLMQAGDYFIISFGVNDSLISDSETFKNALTQMVVRTKAKGGVPIIVTGPGMLSDFSADGTCYVPDRWFKEEAKAVCSAQNCNYVDLHALAAAYFTDIGYSDTKYLYWINWSGEQDTLHMSREGSGQIARLLTEELIRQGIWRFDSVLADYGVINHSATLKCSGIYDGNKLILQNLKPTQQDISVLVNGYNGDGVLTHTHMQTIRLKPYNVLAPSETETVLINNKKNCTAFLIDSDKIESLNNTSSIRNFTSLHSVAIQKGFMEGQ